MKNELREVLQKTIDDLGFASSDLREALNKSNPVDALLILPMIRKVNETRSEVEAFLSAKECMWYA